MIVIFNFLSMLVILLAGGAAIALLPVLVYTTVKSIEASGPFSKKKVSMKIVGIMYAVSLILFASVYFYNMKKDKEMGVKPTSSAYYAMPQE